MKKSTVERDAADAMRGGRGLSRLLVWAGLLVLILLALLQFGCQSLHISDAEAQALFDRAVTRIRERLAEDPKPLPDTTADAIDYTSLHWDYGGFNGRGALLNPDARIADLNTSKTALSYTWVSGGCEALGADNAGDPAATICAVFFKQPDGSWRGGKFDWISTSRTSRNLHHAIGPKYYSNWQSATIPNPADIAFVIVSVRNGTRSNIIISTLRR